MNDQTNLESLSGLELAKYVLNRLTSDHDSIERNAEDFEKDVKYITGVIDFLINIRWVKQDAEGNYTTTRKGQTFTTRREKLKPNFKVPA